MTLRPLVSGFIVAMRMLPGRIWRDHGLDAACGCSSRKLLGAVASIGQQTTRVANHAGIRPRAPTKSWVLPGEFRKGKRTADIVCQCVDFGGLLRRASGRLHC